MVETIRLFLGLTNSDYDFFIIIISIMMIFLFFYYLAQLLLFLMKWVGNVK